MPRRSTAVGALTALALAASAALSPGGRAAEDWDSVNWRALSFEMREFLCGRDRAPAWCPEWRAWSVQTVAPPPNYRPADVPRQSAAPAPPAKAVPDEAWTALVARLAVAKPGAEDLATVNDRAFRDGDPAALEILGYLYATGWGVEAAFDKAYEYYGLAFLAGASHVKENMDQLWAQLPEDVRERLRARFEAAPRSAPTPAGGPAGKPASEPSTGSPPAPAPATRAQPRG